MNRDSKKNFVRDKKLEFIGLFDEWLEEINQMVESETESYLVNNKIVDLRNWTCDFLDKCLTELIAGFKHGVDLKVPGRRAKKPPTRSYGTPCEICGEKRVTNRCHIIPRSEGGPHDEGNILNLCPTHHFLFDHARLSKDEFSKIPRDRLLLEAREYLDKIHSSRHVMRWKYQTNRFQGCECGSRDFTFKCRREGRCVEIVLECKRCKEKWLNLWEELHPISLLKTIVYDTSLSEAEARIQIDEGEKRIKRFLKKDLRDLLSGSEW